jgi:hypothetical protein
MKYSAIAWLFTCSARGPGRIGGVAQREGGHLQRRRPAFAPLVQQRHVIGGDIDAEISQEVAAVSQREVQVAVPKLTELTRHPEPVQPQRGVGAAG